VCSAKSRWRVPALWVQLNAAGQVALELETPWRDGLAGRARPVAVLFARHKQSTGLFVSGLSTTHLVMSPLEFMQRLAALVPRPRPLLNRFGVRVTSLREVSGPRCANMGCWRRTRSCARWWCRRAQKRRR
jgi:hypothetical protein